MPARIRPLRSLLFAAALVAPLAAAARAPQPAHAARGAAWADRGAPR